MSQLASSARAKGVVSGAVLVAVLGARIAGAQQEEPYSLGYPLAPGANQAPAVGGGAFTQGARIDVPSFHGLEPRLVLGYSSDAPTGLAGTGWGLSGFSVIERAKAGRGTPRYDTNDIFLLDGAELIPCPTSGPSASCAAGGTHSTRKESYLKIRRDDPSVDKWTVWGRDGTRTVFEPTFTTSAGGIYRWGQKSVTDTNGNSVTYAWYCADDPAIAGTQIQDCYPDSASYGPYGVKLYLEDRPDDRSFATGDTSRLGKTTYRLRSVLVSYNGSQVRAYKLTYKAGGSAVTGRSLLESIEQYGSDVAIDATGAISGASPLPARRFTYRSDAAGSSFQSWPN